MSKAWQEFNRIEKAVATLAAFIIACGIIFGALWGGYDHFATKAYSDSGDTTVKENAATADKKLLTELHTYQEQQLISDNRAEIWRAKREIKRLNRSKRTGDLTVMDVILIDEDIKDFTDLIECIKGDKELCY